MKWLAFPEGVEVNGLAWFEEITPKLSRFPQRMEDILPEPVYQLGLYSTGVRIRLATDSSSFAVKARYPKAVYRDNLTQFNQRGQALYVDGHCWSIKVPESVEGEAELVFFHDVTRKARELCLYLPLYGEVEILAVGIDEDAQILAPCPFSVPKPIVFYGTSITQGGCASRPGLSYQGIACRQLNLDYMNFGFSGRGKCELVIAQTIAQIDAACYVLDVGSNNKPPEEFRQRFHPFLEHLVNERPNVPVLVMMPSWFNAELWSEKELDENNHRREIVRETVEYWQNREAIVSILERKDCIGEAFSECTVDGKHPNEFGFAQIAKNLIPALSQILEL